MKRFSELLLGSFLFLSLRDYLQILRRGKWLVIAVMLVIPAAVVAYSLQQPASYRASAEVFLSRQDIAAALSGVPDSSSSQNAARDVQTQADLARVATVARAAIADAEVSKSLDTFLKDSSVTLSPNTDLLTFQVEHSTRNGAERLADAYARAFARYRRTLDTASLLRAQREVTARLQSLKSATDQASTLYQSLEAKNEELRVLRALQTPHAVVVQTAQDATKVWPKPVRNGVLAFVLALMLGFGLAFLRDALDTRMRSALEIAERLKLPLLARLPKPPRHLLKQNKLVMLAEPHGGAAEGFRVLRANLDMVNVDLAAHIIMVASAVREEGKSTTIANLAVAAARTGRRVVLVDLDLRRGDIDQFFGVADRLGITDVALGRVSLADALVRIGVKPVPSQGPTAPCEPTGILQILPAGQLPPDPGELVVSNAVAEILEELEQTADLILVDAPPLLQTSDAMAITALVDGVVVVTQLGVRRPVLDELGRTLTRSTADKLGVIVTGEESHYAGYASKRPSRQDGASSGAVGARPIGEEEQPHAGAVPGVARGSQPATH